MSMLFLIRSLIRSLVQWLIQFLNRSLIRVLFRSLIQLRIQKIPTPNPPYQPLGWSYRYRISEVGGVSPTGKSFRSFVRACERSCVCPRDDVVSVAGRFLGKSPPGRRGAARVPFPVVANFCFSLFLSSELKLNMDIA